MEGESGLTVSTAMRDDTMMKHNDSLPKSVLKLNYISRLHGVEINTSNTAYHFVQVFPTADQ